MTAATDSRRRAREPLSPKVGDRVRVDATVTQTEGETIWARIKDDIEDVWFPLSAIVEIIERPIAVGDVVNHDDGYANWQGVRVLAIDGTDAWLIGRNGERCTHDLSDLTRVQDTVPQGAGGE